MHCPDSHSPLPIWPHSSKFKTMSIFEKKKKQNKKTNERRCYRPSAIGGSGTDGRWADGRPPNFAMIRFPNKNKMAVRPLESKNKMAVRPLLEVDQTKPKSQSGCCSRNFTESNQCTIFWSVRSISFGPRLPYEAERSFFMTQLKLKFRCTWFPIKLAMREKWLEEKRGNEETDSNRSKPVRGEALINFSGQRHDETVGQRIIKRRGKTQLKQKNTKRKEFGRQRTTFTKLDASLSRSCVAFSVFRCFFPVVRAISQMLRDWASRRIFIIKMFDDPRKNEGDISHYANGSDWLNPIPSSSLRMAFKKSPHEELDLG